MFQSVFSLWLFLSLLAPLLWAIGNIFDRILITGYFPKPFAFTLASGLARLPFVALLFAVSGFSVRAPSAILLALFSGILVAFAVFCYIKALEESDPSTAILFYDAIGPILVLCFSALLLGQYLNARQGWGFFFLFLAGLLSSFSFEGRIRFKRGVFWMLPGALLWSFSDIILAALTPQFASVFELIAWQFLGVTLGSLLYLPKTRLTDFRLPSAAWVIFAASVIPCFVGYGLFLKAIALGPVSLTVALSNIQPLYIFLFEAAASKIRFPLTKIFHNLRLDTRTILPKAAAFGCVLVGVGFLQATS